MNSYSTWTMYRLFRSMLAIVTIHCITKYIYMMHNGTFAKRDTIRIANIQVKYMIWVKLILLVFTYLKGCKCITIKVWLSVSFCLQRKDSINQEIIAL